MITLQEKEKTYCTLKVSLRRQVALGYFLCCIPYAIHTNSQKLTTDKTGASHRQQRYKCPKSLGPIVTHPGLPSFSTLPDSTSRRALLSDVMHTCSQPSNHIRFKSKSFGFPAVGNLLPFLSPSVPSSYCEAWPNILFSNLLSGYDLFCSSTYSLWMSPLALYHCVCPGLDPSPLSVSSLPLTKLVCLPFPVPLPVSDFPYLLLPCCLVFCCLHRLSDC